MEISQELNKLVVFEAAGAVLAEEVLHEAAVLDGPPAPEPGAEPVIVGGPLPIIRPHQGHHLLELLLVYLPAEREGGERGDEERESQPWG